MLHYFYYIQERKNEVPKRGMLCHAEYKAACGLSWTEVSLASFLIPWQLYDGFWLKANRYKSPCPQTFLSMQLVAGK